MKPPPLGIYVLSPLQQIKDAPSWGYFWSVIVGVVQFLATDLFTGILALVALAAGVDYFWGRKVAQLDGSFSSKKAEVGLHGKFLGIILLLLIRAFEWWLSRASIIAETFDINTHGLLAVVLGVILLAKELDSIDHHRQALGGEPWPLFDHLLRLMRRVPNSVLKPPRNGKGS